MVQLKKAKTGELIGYDRFKHKNSKIHVIVNENSMPLSVKLRPRNENDSKKFDELLKELNKIPEEFYGIF